MPPDQNAAVDGLLVALERLTEQAKDRARDARVGIEGRLEGQPAALIAKTRERLLASRRRALTLSIEAAFNIFFALSAFSNLPIGVREVFTQELRHLNDAKTELRSPAHAGKLAADLEQNLETAEMILNEVIAKAPALVDFGLGR
jgi:hypothetical protein